MSAKTPQKKPENLRPHKEMQPHPPKKQRQSKGFCMPYVVHCNCTSKKQDKKYGEGIRLVEAHADPFSGLVPFRCVICCAEKNFSEVWSVIVE